MLLVASNFMIYLIVLHLLNPNPSYLPAVISEAAASFLSISSICRFLSQSLSIFLLSLLVFLRLSLSLSLSLSFPLSIFLLLSLTVSISASQSSLCLHTCISSTLRMDPHRSYATTGFWRTRRMSSSRIIILWCVHRFHCDRTSFDLPLSSSHYLFTLSRSIIFFYLIPCISPLSIPHILSPSSSPSSSLVGQCRGSCSPLL